MPASLTSYDFLKFAALSLMIVDHIGVFFFDENDLWLRAVGRLSAPIWLFLIGFARSRDLSAPIWIGTGIVFVSNYVFGLPLFPVNILGTIILCRLALDPVMDMLRRNPKALYPFCALLFLGTFLTFPAIEYGTEIMMFVMFGYMTRNRDTIPFTREQYMTFALVACMSHVFMQGIFFFDFNDAQKIFVGGGTVLLTIALMSFRAADYPELTRKLPSPFVWLVQLFGRHSLAIYVVHLLLFKAIAHLAGFSDHSLFEFTLL